MAFIMGKIIDLTNDIVDKISVYMSLYYTQIEGNSNILGGIFSNFKLIFSVFLRENQDFLF